MKDAAAQANHHRVRAIVCVQLRKNVLQVAVDSVFTDGEAVRDFLIPVSGCHELKHLRFARRETAVGEMLRESRRESGGDASLSAVDQADLLHDLAAFHTLQKVTLRACR